MPGESLVPHPQHFKFYLDENFPVPAGEFLKSLGHSVIIGITHLGKQGLPDYKHIQAATQLDAILLAFDRDFMVDADLRQRIAGSPGVILVEAADTKPETTQRILNKVLKDISYPKLRGKVCRASIDRIVYLSSS